MGDRAEVRIKPSYGDNGEVYLYTHWGGYALPATVAAALDRGCGRWGDTSYLSRIIFSEMIRGDVEGDTGYGISAQGMQDTHTQVFVDDDAQEVTIHRRTFSPPYEDWIPGVAMSYEDFIPRYS